MIGIVDYGMGNLLSVYHALEAVGAYPRLCSRPKELRKAERFVLPGVGAFRDCMENLKRRGLVEALNELVIEKGFPILGICLGMQAMARTSSEGGQYEGLGWFAADVVLLQPSDATLRIPHIGWNAVSYSAQSPLFTSLPREPDFYFVHSYYVKCDHEAHVDATCDYGGPVTAAIRRDNIVATQFHPEKSQDYGLRVLKNFLDWNP